MKLNKKFEEESMFWIENIITKIKERDRLARGLYINKIDIDRLIKTNKEIEEKLQKIDATILTTYKPKIVKNNEDTQGLHNDS